MEASRLSGLFEKDSFIKFISIIIAVILWAYVSFVLDPETQKEIVNIPVKYVNEQTLLNAGLIVIKNDVKVSCEVKGRRNVLSSINTDRIWAEVDLAEFSKPGRNRVSLKISGLPSSVQIIKEPEEIFVDLDKAYSVERKITINFKGQPHKGYIAYNPTTSPSIVRLDGSQKIINSIKEVSVSVDISNIDQSFDTTEKIKIIGNNGKEIKDLKSSIDIVNINIPVIKAKEVLVKLSTKNTLSKNLILKELKFAPEKVYLSGEDDELSKIDQVSTETIDLSLIESDVTKSVKVVLPQGTNLVNSINTISVEINVEKQLSKTITVNSSNIIIKNTREDLDYKISSEKTDISLVGLAEKINNSNLNNINPTIDVKDLQEGNYSVPVILSLPEGIAKKTENIFIPIKISKKQ